MISAPVCFVKMGDNEKVGMDLTSLLFRERMVFLFHEINDDLAGSVIQQLLALEALDDRKPIQMYINSPGGSVSAGLAIYDTMCRLKCSVETICVGSACSMAAVLLAAGTKGRRYATENSTVMIHQVLGGASGQATDVEIACRNIIQTKERLNKLLSGMTGQAVEKVRLDCERDNFMTAEQAMEYGIIDRVLENGGIQSDCA